MSFKIKSSDHLFSAPVSIFEIADSKRLNKKLIAESRNWKMEHSGLSKSNFGESWHSPTSLLSRNEPGFSEISSMIIKIAANYAMQLNPELKIEKFNFDANAWVNINGKGGYNTVHHHGWFHISGVYYIKQPSGAKNRSGMIEFINSRFDNHIFEEIGGQPFAPSLRMRPAPGEMLVFPSTLLHFVYPNETSEERISLAWNLKFRKK